jgi:hypothetical protein
MTEAEPPERWQRCSLCRELPASSHEFWKGGELESGGFPAAAKQLEVVGAPYFDDSTSHTHDCLKRCPACGTIYAWTMEYEFLVPRSEDYLTLTRLSPEAGEAEVRKTLAAVAEQQARFAREGPQWARVLETATDPAALGRAVFELQHHQTVYREDLSFAVPALVGVLVKHQHVSGRCELAQQVEWALENFGRRGPEARAVLTRALDALEPKQARRPELKALRAWLDSE